MSKSFLERRRVLNEAISDWDARVTPNNYALDLYLRKSGYKLINVSRYSKGIRLGIVPRKKGYHTPEIYHDYADNIYEIQTTSYGTLEVSDIEEVIKGYETAISVVKYLMSLDLEKLEVEDED